MGKKRRKPLDARIFAFLINDRLKKNTNRRHILSSQLVIRSKIFFEANFYISFFTIYIFTINLLLIFYSKTLFFISFLMESVLHNDFHRNIELIDCRKNHNLLWFFIFYKNFLQILLAISLNKSKLDSGEFIGLSDMLPSPSERGIF